MAIWGKFMSGAIAGYNAFIQAFNEKDNIPEDEYGWNEYDVRLRRYAFLQRWYNNTQYYQLINAVATKYKTDNNLYRHIRGIHNPTYRLVEMYTSKLYPGAINYKDPSMGAIPIQTDNEALYEAIPQLFQWSNWQTEKDVFVRNGAIMGDTAIKVVDNRQKGKVKIEVLNPMYIKDVLFDDSGNVIMIVIEYQRNDNPNDPNMRDYTYTEVITKDWFETYKNGAPFGFYEDMQGNPLPRWENEYGFVPVTINQHRNLGLAWGVPAVPPAAFPKINECNDLASVIDDAVRKAVNPMYKSTGTRPSKGVNGTQDVLSFEMNERDNLAIMHIPQSAQFEQIQTNLDLTGALANLTNKLQELENDMPELSLTSMRDREMSGVAIQNLYSDGISRFTQAMGGYDDTKVRAIQMACTIGGMGGYRGFTAFNEQSYDRGELEMYIEARPVIDDTMSDQQRVDILSRRAEVSPIVIMKLMGVPDDIIEMQMEYDIQQSASATQALIDAIGMGDNGEEASDDNTGATSESGNGVVPIEDAATGQVSSNGNLAGSIETRR